MEYPRLNKNIQHDISTKNVAKDSRDQYYHYGTNFNDIFAFHSDRRFRNLRASISED